MSDTGNESRPPVIKEKLTTFLNAVLSLPTLLAVIVVVSFYLIWSLSPFEVDKGISTVDYARGLITLLFAVGTIAIALILTLAAVFQTDPDAKERLGRGKEVLTALIGIFGTIVGFYFGSAARPPQSATGSFPAVVDEGGGAKSEGDQAGKGAVPEKGKDLPKHEKAGGMK